ncbi:MAG TPA: hypothetical protein RMH85_11950 [Polyangiaceae bacterium LLY-WYZ-15_(1-7)]|nr:hypothetical protein [Myxococcales bacterium]MAT26995.1 hypothetical protein [Sandaracinus sp.]HJK93595.1 hypothetical protein [Polyangiaceae bacterium LLY-WYZ-15_(1-7)]MBJ70509.1 hypothetical protein [Sandaracinus sp.]HJL06602.1 hypothetical protein [Polyangiaceae bacterium LLY-WYZ-15_(1-7)]
MEVTLVNRSVYDLPSRQRVGCIVYDGAADMQLWPGPGPDSDLHEHYGDGLQRALDAELKQVEGRLLEIPSVVRVHPGRLHCNFLLWVASRPPEPGSTRQPAPGADVLRQAVLEALRFAAKRNVERIAFPALGAGPGELPRADRLVIAVRAAHAYHEQCIAAGRAPGVEEVFVCEASGPAFRTARQKVQGLARAETKPIGASGGAKAPAKRRRSASSSSSSSKKKSSKVAHKTPPLTAEEVAAARNSERYSMKNTYAVGDFFLHPKFGVGKVVGQPAPGQILVMFETGAEKKLVHGRS